MRRGGGEVPQLDSWPRLGLGDNNDRQPRGRCARVGEVTVVVRANKELCRHGNGDHELGLEARSGEGREEARGVAARPEMGWGWCGSPKSLHTMTLAVSRGDDQGNKLPHNSFWCDRE